jgi:hypothetical protein
MEEKSENRAFLISLVVVFVGNWLFVKAFAAIAGIAI